MASDTQRAPVSAAMSGTVHFNNGRPVIVNLGLADEDVPGHSVGNDASDSPATNPVPSVLPSVRSLLMSCERSLPFILIVLAKLLYDHRLGMHSAHNAHVLAISRNSPLRGLFFASLKCRNKSIKAGCYLLKYMGYYRIKFQCTLC